MNDLDVHQKRLLWIHEQPNMKRSESTKTADTRKTIVASLFTDREQLSRAKDELKCFP